MLLSSGVSTATTTGGAAVGVTFIVRYTINDVDECKHISDLMRKYMHNLLDEWDELWKKNWGWGEFNLMQKIRWLGSLMGGVCFFMISSLKVIGVG